LPAIQLASKSHAVSVNIISCLVTARFYFADNPAQIGVILTISTFPASGYHFSQYDMLQTASAPI